MAEGYEVLEMLIPEGGWEIKGNDYSGITFFECESISEAEFLDGFGKLDVWKAEQQVKVLAAKKAAEAKLTALGLTVDDLKVLGLG